jgi:hypothetical protein
VFAARRAEHPRIDMGAGRRQTPRALPFGCRPTSRENTMNLRKTARIAYALAATLMSCLSVHATAAGLFRAYVASTGNDANPCTLSQPCRLLPAALTAVADGGEIWMLDSANYNTATVIVGKSVSILAVPGAVGSVVATGGPAISITASGLTISLRNVVIVPLPASGATDGVNMTGNSDLMIENSLIANLPNDGVNIVGFGSVKIADTIIRGSGNYAVSLQEGASGDLAGTKLLANGSGGLFAQTTTAVITTASLIDSVILGGNIAVNVYTSSSSGVTKVSVTRCSIERAADTLVSQTAGVGSAVISVSGSMITNNNRGWYQSGTGSIIRSLGNNHITDNNISPTGVLTATALQ